MKPHTLNIMSSCSSLDFGQALDIFSKPDDKNVRSKSCRCSNEGTPVRAFRKAAIKAGL
jgi:hypothetical protein